MRSPRSTGDGRDFAKTRDLPGGSIRNVVIRNVIAHGQGSCLITGHPKSWLENITLENVKLFTSTDPASPYDKSVNAMHFQYARNLSVKDVEINWERPEWRKWQSALYFEDVNGLTLEDFVGGPARPQAGLPAVVLDRVEDAAILDSKARAGTQVFLKVKGPQSKRIYMVGNDLHNAAVAVQLDPNVKAGVVKAINNF